MDNGNQDVAISIIILLPVLLLIFLTWFEERRNK